MYNLYSKFIHYNEYTKKWNVFERDEAIHYLNNPSVMKSLKSYDSIEELLNDNKQTNND